MFSVVDKENFENVLQVSVRGDVKFNYLCGRNDEMYKQITDRFLVNKIEFSNGKQGGIQYSITHSASSVTENCKRCYIVK